jgi:hypothetical protein
MSATHIELLATALFCIAILHTFSASFFEHLSHKYPNHSGLWHLAGEIETVFGFWALILIIGMTIIDGNHEPAIKYLENCNYTEPLFVFAIMVVSASKPILILASSFVKYTSLAISTLTGLKKQTSNYFITLSLVPLLGSFITEPAAMTLAALLLKKEVFSKSKHIKLMYLTIGTLFVNISIGGALTNFAAPPILMVANTWGWSTNFVFQTFGLKTIAAVFVNAILVTALCHKLLPINEPSATKQETIPVSVSGVHLIFLIGIVVFAHHPVVFMGMLLFFMGYTHAYQKYQSPLLLKEALLVAFFLAGLVVLGGLQQWWLQPLLERLNSVLVFFGAFALTAITDNAALTYLGSLVEGTSDEFKYSLVAGAITGGGLTVIANAPNPAGLSILREHFPEKSVSALNLFLAALPPTIIAMIAFQLF